MKRVARTGNAKRPLSFHRLPGLSQLAFSLRPPSLRFALRTYGSLSEACGVPSMPPPLEYSRGCIVFVIFNHRALRTKYLQFFEVSAWAALSPTEVKETLGPRILDSAAGNPMSPAYAPTTAFYYIIKKQPGPAQSAVPRAKVPSAEHRVRKQSFNLRGRETRRGQSHSTDGRACPSERPPPGRHRRGAHGG